MVQWINRTIVQTPRNGTSSHSITFAPATAGNLLVCVVEGAVTSSTPSGWTLPSGGSAINITGLYVWRKTATAGESSLTTTHNGSNYPVAFVVYEFPAGSTFVKSVSGSGIGHGDPNPNLTSLTGTNLLFGVVAAAAISTISAGAVTWSGTPAPTEDTDVLVPAASGTDGYLLSIGYAEEATVTSWQPTGTLSGATSMASKEALTFAVNVVTATNEPPVVTAAADIADVEPGTVVTTSATATDDGTIANWSVSSVPTLTFQGTGNSRTFIAPPTLAGQSYTITWTATDDGGLQDTDDQVVGVLASVRRINVGGTMVPAFRRLIT